MKISIDGSDETSEGFKILAHHMSQAGRLAQIVIRAGQCLEKVYSQAIIGKRDTLYKPQNRLENPSYPLVSSYISTWHDTVVDSTIVEGIGEPRRRRL